MPRRASMFEASSRGPLPASALPASLDGNEREFRPVAARFDRHDVLLILRAGDELQIALERLLPADRPTRTPASPEVDVSTALGDLAVGPQLVAVELDHPVLRIP